MEVAIQGGRGSRTSAVSSWDIRTSGDADLQSQGHGAGSCRDPTHAEAKVGIATPICSEPP